jgi:hypothetical protein
MPTALRREIRHHATDLLTAAGINEPLTWSPPKDCAAGLDLPGREPDDIDTNQLHQLVIVDGLKPKAAAQQLDVSIEHIRYTLQQLHRPTPNYPKNSPVTVRNVRARAAALLTHDFFQHHNVDLGKDITTLATETGIPRRIIHRYARLAGFTFTRAAPHPDILHTGTSTNDMANRHPRIPPPRRTSRVDRTWLQEQAGTLFRTNDDIAAELGLRGETIRRYRRDYGIRGAPPDQAATSSPTCTTRNCHRTSAGPSKDNATAGNAWTGSSR